MRRIVGSLIVVLALAIGSSTALAAQVQKTTVKAVIAGGGWELIDEATGAGEFGDVQFATAEGKTTVALLISSGELVLCAGEDTPDDPFDDVYGFVGTETVGEGVGKLTVGKSYSSAVATGTVAAEVFTFDECTGDEGTVTKKTIAVALDLTGISPVVHEKLRSTISIPARLRTKTMISAESREAAGSVTVGRRTIEVGGVIGQLQMRATVRVR